MNENTDALIRATRHHRCGHLKEAEKICSQILASRPDHSYALNLSGLIAFEGGNYDEAINRLRRAIAKNPQFPYLYKNLGKVYQRQGLLDRAAACYGKAHELNPGDVQALYEAGCIYLNTAQQDRAIVCFETAIKLKPDHIQALFKLGVALTKKDRLEDAVACYLRCIQLEPWLAETYNNLGLVYKDQGKVREAIVFFKKATEIKPQLPQAHCNLGNIYKEQERHREALDKYREALKADPQHLEACFNLGLVFDALGRGQNAVLSYRKALKIKPDFIEALNNLAVCLQNQGRIREAIFCFEKAIKLSTDIAPVYHNLSLLYAYHERYSEAISCSKIALEIDPYFPEARQAIVDQLRNVCDWGAIAKFEKHSGGQGEKKAVAVSGLSSIPVVGSFDNQDPRVQLEVAKNRSQAFEKSIALSATRFDHASRRRDTNKITIGYLSNNFRDHPTAQLVCRIFELHDRKKFATHCYSYGKNDGSAYRNRIENGCDKFVDLLDFNAEEAAKQIFSDNVQILVDLNGYTAFSRMDICALKPSPIQVRYLGLAGTTGASFFDYLITDAIVTPDEHAPFYTEKFVFMPHSYQVNNNRQAVANQSLNRKRLSLPANGFVFGSFVTSYKIDQYLFHTWMNILARVHGSVLWLLKRSKATLKNLRKEAVCRGIDPNRLIFAEKLPKSAHLDRLGLTDLALDTRSVNGAATTSDALWVGVPVLTLQGSHFVSRMSSSILTAIGLPELITYSLKSYEDLAVELATDPARLRTIKDKIEKKRITEPLFDTKRFVRNLENAYEQIWQIYTAGELPRPIKVRDCLN
jgi:protein O-GlcNAc transferase